MASATDEWVQSNGGWYLQGKPFPIATSPPTNSTGTDAVSHPGLQSKRTATNHLSHVEIPLTFTTQPPHTTAWPTICCWILLQLSLHHHRTIALVKHYNKKPTFLCAVQHPKTAGNVCLAVRSSFEPLTCATSQSTVTLIANCCSLCIRRPTELFTNVTIFK